jgi:hypothetical protein
MDGKRSLAIGAVIGLSAALAACNGGGAGTVPNSAAPAPSGALTKIGGNPTSTLKATLLTVSGPNLELDFADALKDLSAGSIDVSVSGWRPDDLNNESDLVNEVAGGNAQLGYIGARGFDTAGVTSFDGFQAPMLIDSFDLQAKVLATELTGPRNSSTGLDRSGSSDSDMSRASSASLSASLGIWPNFRPSHVTDMTMSALGATSVPIPAGSVKLSGLDGIELGMPGVAGNGYDRGARSFTGNLVFWARPNIIFANAKWFAGLSTDQQGLLRAAADKTYQGSAAKVRQDAVESRGIACARGFSIVSASKEALDAFRQKLRPVIAEMAKDPTTKATIDAILALRGPSDAPDVVAPCPKTGPSPSSSAGPTALDGTWKTSFTKADLISSPLLIDNGEISDGNWGDFTMTFDHGKFTSTGSNSIEHGTGSGTFTVTGDAVTLHLDQTGETFALRWSIFKNTLLFKRDETLGGGPTPFLVKPWTRVP